MRFAGNLDYYATLPIRREALIIATVISFFLLSLPSLLVTVIFGAFFLKIHLVINPSILILVPLCVLPLAGLGAVIGVYSRTPSALDSLSLLLTMLMLFIGPVLIPANRLPSLLISLGYLSPANKRSFCITTNFTGAYDTKISSRYYSFARVYVDYFLVYCHFH